MKHLNVLVRTFSNFKTAGKEYWFWASVLLTILSLGVAWSLVGETIKVWNRPRVMEVHGGLEKTDVSEKEYMQAADILRGLIPHEDNGQPTLTVLGSVGGITLTGVTLNAHEAFITALWQLPAMIPNSSWEFEELCLGSGCSSGSVVAKVKAQHIQISMKLR